MTLPRSAAGEPGLRLPVQAAVARLAGRCCEVWTDHHVGCVHPLGLNVEGQLIGHVGRALLPVLLLEKEAVRNGCTV